VDGENSNGRWRRVCALCDAVAVLPGGARAAYLAQACAGDSQLRQEVGRGGMGTVWRAERVDGGFRQTVAIKLIKRWMDTNSAKRPATPWQSRPANRRRPPRQRPLSHPAFEAPSLSASAWP
jgi:hypothetical protein